jgi:aminomethyltransferase
MAETAPLIALPLDALWRARAKKFGAFAGYDMPLEFEGLMAEHHWTRAQAGLFDVSHMGPCFLRLNDGALTDAQARHEAVAALIEALVPADIRGLKPGQVRYTTLLDDHGGVLDDLMIARPAEADLAGVLHVVVNAGCKHQDWALIESAVGARATLERADDRVLLALQGPAAADAIGALLPEAPAMAFMTLRRFGALFVTRSGYTGEDGFEILAPVEDARALVAHLLADARVKPVGLGARDSLRLEAGLCLYGHDLDETTSPIEADLAWTIQKRRRLAADFPGAERILRELNEGPARKRVGIRPLDRAPAREGVDIFAGNAKIGVVTSGGFSPILNAPISMGYVDAAEARIGAEIALLVRGQPRPAEIVALPFVPHRYAKK